MSSTLFHFHRSQIYNSFTLLFDTNNLLTHSLTGPLDWRRVVAPSRLHNLWPCFKQSQQRAQCRSPADGPRLASDNLADLLLPTYFFRKSFPSRTVSGIHRIDFTDFWNLYYRSLFSVYFLCSSHAVD